MKISIPKPCHENWEGMTPEEKGRFCGMCQKTVVDFTDMAPDEIRHFFKEHDGQKICGRFRNEQLAQPTKPLLPEALVNRIASRPMGFRQMFVVALLVCMGSTLFSCNNTKSEPAVAVETPVDTTAAVSRTTGISAVSLDTNVIEEVKPKAIVHKKIAKTEEPKEFPALMGEVVQNPSVKAPPVKGDTIVVHKP